MACARSISGNVYCWTSEIDRDNKKPTRIALACE
jgi:hypothetical protein